VQSISAILRATVTITPRISLQAFAQLFTEGLAYGDPLRAVVGPAIRLDQLTRATAADQAPSLDDRNADLSMNLVLRWEWRLGSTLYLVYAHQTAGSAESTDHQL